MKKLFRLRDWLTLDEAARHLSLVLQEEVSLAEVLRLGLDGHLTLSVDFVNHAEAYIGRVVAFKDVPMMRLPPINLDGTPAAEPLLVPDGLQIDGLDDPTDDTRYVHFERKPVTLVGVWDLAMVGGEKSDVEHRFQRLIGGPPVELINLDGTFVFNEDGEWAQMLDQLDDRVVDTPKGTTSPGKHFPAGGLPRDANLVVRTAALSEFTAALSGEGKCAKAHPGGVATRERDTLLKLVLGMALAGYRYDPQAARSAVATEIAGDLVKHGLAVSDDTVRNYLKEAAATLLERGNKKT